jgi:hypothetical protein
MGSNGLARISPQPSQRPQANAGRRLSLPLFSQRPRSNTDSSLTLAGQRHAVLPGVGDLSTDASSRHENTENGEGKPQSGLRSRSESSFVSFCDLKPLHKRLEGSFIMPREAQEKVCLM